MKIQFGLNNEVVEADYTDPVTDPSRDAKYTEEQKRAAAGTVSPADAKLSVQQQQLDKQTANINYLEAKSTALRGYEKDGTPLFVETAEERAKLTKLVGMHRENLKLSLQLAELSLGEDTLDRHNEEMSLQQTMAEYSQLEQRARAINFEDRAQALAKLFNPKASNGSGLKIR